MPDLSRPGIPVIFTLKLFHLLFEIGDGLRDFESLVAVRIVFLQSLVCLQSLCIVAQDLVGHAQLDEVHRRGEVIGVLLGGLFLIGNSVLLVAEFKIAVADET